MISPDTTSIISVGCYLWGLLTAFHRTSRQLVTSRSRLGHSPQRLGRLESRPKRSRAHPCYNPHSTLCAPTPPYFATPAHRSVSACTIFSPLHSPTDTEIGQERSVSPGTLSPVSRGTLGESAASINPCLACSQP